MQLFRDLNLKAPLAGGTVATIGNFDGIHLGHQSLIQEVEAQAKARGLAGVLVSFEPLAREYFAPQGSPGRIYNAAQRIRQLSGYNLSAVWLMRFNQHLASLSPDDFVKHLRHGINPQAIVVGQGFRFGRDRAGTTETLAAGGQVEAITIDPVMVDGTCLLYTSPSPRDLSTSRMPSSA